MPIMKFKLLSLSGITANKAVLCSPRAGMFSSSWHTTAAICGRLNFSRRTPREMSMLLAVLPAANLKIWYCLTARCSGSRIANRSKSSSSTEAYSSSSSLTSAAFIISITIEKFCSSGGASFTRYRIRASSSAVSARSQKGSLLCAPLGVVLRIRLLTSRRTSLSSRRYTNGLKPWLRSVCIRSSTFMPYP